MVTFQTDNSVFLHVPKTGGTTITNVLSKQLIIQTNYEKHGLPHANLFQLINPPTHKWALIRHPVDWLYSFYNYKMQVGWYTYKSEEFKSYGTSEFASIELAGINTFDEYVERVYSDGKPHITPIFELYIGPHGDRISFVGVMEKLINSVRIAMERFENITVGDIPMANVMNKRFTKSQKSIDIINEHEKSLIIYYQEILASR